MSQDLVPPTPTISETSLNDDWDRSLILQDPSASTSRLSPKPTEPKPVLQNTIVFPAGPIDHIAHQVQEGNRRDEKRSISELLKLHAEKGTDVTFGQEEALRIADVLGQWINASSSPYEADDDFFSRSEEDLSVRAKNSATSTDVRTRGHSECLHRPSRTSSNTLSS